MPATSKADMMIKGILLRMLHSSRTSSLKANLDNRLSITSDLESWELSLATFLRDLLAIWNSAIRLMTYIHHHAQHVYDYDSGHKNMLEVK